MHKHIDRQIPPSAHTPMYNWHKFWGRKTWNVVGEYVEAYCPEGGIVLDPFSGSGVTAIEALRRNRKAVAIDINPVGNEILKKTVEYVDIDKLKEAFARIEKSTKEEILSLYLTKCRKCGKKIAALCFIWKRDLLGREKIVDVRYKCDFCGDIKAQNSGPNREDRTLYARAEEELEGSNLWFPTNRLEYPDGQPFMKREKYQSIDDLFTKRNLLALAKIYNSIEREGNSTIKDFLKISFSSMVHLCSRMMPVRPTRPHSSVWTEPSYWYANTHMEQNVWHKFSSTFSGKQGLIKAKEDSNNFFWKVRLAKRLEDLLKDRADLLVITGSSLDFLRHFEKRQFFVDYIFTDPPYDISIQYGELNYLWACWLKMDDGYLDKMLSDEVIRNDKQGKSFEDYASMLRANFKAMYDVLKPDGYLTLTFHNPTFKVRNATIRAGIFANFDFQKIHHQELARPSAKSLLQPFGSATGDFYLRFHKPKVGRKAISKNQLTEERFRKVVIETTTRLLAERWEPTPYTMIINFIDPQLAKEGYFRELHTGLDVKTVLQNEIGETFKLVEGTIGGASGQLWWFKHPEKVVKHHEIPLSERLEATVLRILRSKYKATFTTIWDRVSTEFPNSLTSDSSSIMDVLREYAIQVSGRYWALKQIAISRIKQHSELIIILSEIGQSLGFDIWIGRKEQGEKVLWKNKGISLRTFCHPKKLSLAEIPKDALSKIRNIDVIWHRNAKVKTIFEIEHTTGMTSALDRGSNIPYHVDRYMVIPEEREKALKSKLKSSLFAENFNRWGWKVIYFDNIFKNYKSMKSGKLKIGELINKKLEKKTRKRGRLAQDTQTSLL